MKMPSLHHQVYLKLEVAHHGKYSVIYSLGGEMSLQGFLGSGPYIAEGLTWASTKSDGR